MHDWLLPNFAYPSAQLPQAIPSYPSAQNPVKLISLPPSFDPPLASYENKKIFNQYTGKIQIECIQRGCLRFHRFSKILERDTNKNLPYKQHYQDISDKILPLMDLQSYMYYSNMTNILKEILLTKIIHFSYIELVLS